MAFNAFKSLLVAGLVVFSALASGASERPNVITVTGSGEMKVDPDVAYLDGSIVTRGMDVATVQQENATKVAAVLQVLTVKKHIDTKDIKTTGYNVSADYDYPQTGPRVLKGYVVKNTLRLTIHRLDQAGSYIDAVGKAGVNDIDAITFSTEKQKSYELKTLKLAVQDARAQGDAIAAALDKPIKKILTVSTVGSVAPQPYMARAMAPPSPGMAGMEGTSIASGQITVTSQVVVEYEF